VVRAVTVREALERPLDGGLLLVSKRRSLGFNEQP
jgi:hypothetical protein